MTRAVISLGSNLGDRYQYIALMEESIGYFSDVIRRSPLYETAPVGVTEAHGNYLNRVLLIETALSVEELLGSLQQIELQLDRTGKGELSPRTADLDILLYAGVSIESASLTVPHHALFDRRFSYEGALAVAPDWPLECGSTLRQYPVDADVLKQEMKVVEQSL